MNDIIIISEERSGSSFLCLLLGQFEEFRILHEFFFNILQNQNESFDLSILKDQDQNLIYNAFQVEQGDQKKLKNIMASDPEFAYHKIHSIFPAPNVIKVHRENLRVWNLNFLITNNNNFIFLNRSNKLAQFCSLVIAKKIGVFNSQNTSDMSIEIDPKEYLQFKHERVKDDEFYLKLLQDQGKNILMLNYENDIDNSIEILEEKVKSWLFESGYSIKIHPWFSPEKHLLNKQNHSPLKRIIVNYDQVINL